MKTALLIEDDENGLTRAITVSLSQNLINEYNCYIDSNIKWIWVKSFKEFTQYITHNNIPDILAFDHDLGSNSYHKNDYKGIDYNNCDEPTGYHCAKWLIEYCQDNKINLECEVYSHSMNPEGRNNIISLLNNFKKFQNKYGT